MDLDHLAADSDRPTVRGRPSGDRDASRRRNLRRIEISACRSILERRRDRIRRRIHRRGTRRESVEGASGIDSRRQERRSLLCESLAGET